MDVVALNIPDYLTVVKEPMDLGSIEEAFRRREYSTANQLLADVNKVWLNSYRYNPKTSDIYKMTQALERHFLKISKQEPKAQPRPRAKE